MEKIPLADLGAQYRSIKSEIDAALQRVIDNSSFILGREVETFEREFAAFCGTAHAVGVSSGTDALHLALRACRVGSDDEVITTPLTFAATAESILMCGARPVLVDVDPETLNIDPERIEAAITPRTRAIVPVHLYGQPADMDAIDGIAAPRGLLVIEDAAQGHGALYRNRRVGSLGRAAAFSFYPGKNLGAFGDGGALTTDDPEIAARVAQLRDHGRSSKYVHEIRGYNNRMDALQAAVLRTKLPYLDGWNSRRREVAERYTAKLADSPVRTPNVPQWATPVWHQYVVRVEGRDELQRLLKESGIHTGIHYPVPLHQQPALQELALQAGAFPNADAAAAEVLSLPMYAELTEAMVERVVEAVLARA